MGEISRAEALSRFGVDPETIGLRNRGWWIVDEIEDEESQAGARVGDLCVKTRDGGYNPVDPDAFRYSNYRGTACDSFDFTYRYYYYAPLAQTDRKALEEAGDDVARTAVPALIAEVRRLQRIEQAARDSVAAVEAICGRLNPRSRYARTYCVPAIKAGRFCEDCPAVQVLPVAAALGEEWAMRAMEEEQA